MTEARALVPAETMTAADDAHDLEAAVWFLEADLRERAASRRLLASCAIDDDDPNMAGLYEAAANRLEELAEKVDEIPTALLLEYTKAIEFDQQEMIHCSMTLEIGFALNPQSIEDVCRIYVRAVECLQCDPRFANGGDVRDFWMEFKNAGHA